MEFDNRRLVRINRNINAYILKSIGEHKVLPLKNIIAAFPGSGKTVASKWHDSIYIDVDESEFHWVKDEDGNRVVNPEWPSNYIDAVLDAAANEDSQYRYILVPTDKDVIAELDNRHIVYSALIPKTKEAAIEKNSHKGEDFIKHLSDDYDEYIDAVCKSKVHSIYVSDSYLNEVFP